MILCRGAAPQRIHTSFEKATSKGLSVRGYTLISSLVASLSGKKFLRFLLWEENDTEFLKDQRYSPLLRLLQGEYLIASKETRAV